MRYVLYEGPGGNILFTKEELVKSNPDLLNPFENKTPVAMIEANDDSDAIKRLNNYMISKVDAKK